MGRLVANHDFVRALLRYGTFDEFVFSGPSAGSVQAFERAVDGWGLDPDRRAAVRLVPLPMLADLAATTPFHVFHLGGWGYFMPGLHRLRSRARAPWPITGVIHSLHGRETFDQAVRVAAAGMATFDAIICSSHDGRRALDSMLSAAGMLAGSSFAGRLPVLPLGIDDALADRKGDGARLRRRLRLEDDARVLLVLGRLTPALKMDLAPLFRLVRHLVLPHCGFPVRLVVAGGASEADVRLVQGLVAEHGLQTVVRLYPNFQPEAKAELLAAADLLIALVDNAQETFGLSLLEALCHGVPVVASRFSGFKDLVDDGVDGRLVDTWWSAPTVGDDLEDLLDPTIAQLHQAQSVAVDLARAAEAVVELLHDEGRRREMGERGQAKVHARYLWRAVIPRFEALWDELAAEAAGAAPVDGRNPFHVPQVSLFGHYVSRSLDDATLLGPGPIPFACRPYTDIGPLLPAPLLARLVERVGQGAELSELLGSIDAPAPAVRFAVGWLLKYGMLAVSSR